MTTNTAPRRPRRETAPTTRWLDDREMAAWRGFVDTLAPLLQALDADLAPFGLTHGDYEVLVRLSEQSEGRLKMCDLAAALSLSASGCTRRLAGLVDAGLVERASCSEDRRVIYAALTAAGRRMLERAAPTHVAGVRRLFVDHLSAEECAVLAEAFAKVRDATLRP